jgi:hypothetical protein
MLYNNNISSLFYIIIEDTKSDNTHILLIKYSFIHCLYYIIVDRSISRYII